MCGPGARCAPSRSNASAPALRAQSSVCVGLNHGTEVWEKMPDLGGFAGVLPWMSASGPAIRSMFSGESTRCHGCSVNKHQLSPSRGRRPRARRTFSARSLQILDDGDLPPVGAIWAQAVHVEAAVPGQAAHHGTEGQRPPGGRVSVLVHVGRQRPLARRHLLAERRVDAQLGGQLALDGGGALELVVDVNAEASPRLLELCRHVCRPLGRVSSELTDLPAEDIVIYSQLLMNAHYMPVCCLSEMKDVCIHVLGCCLERTGAISALPLLLFVYSSASEQAPI